MTLIIEATLSVPPSSVHCFRDVSLYASTFKESDVLVSCEDKVKDIYWRWLKRYGAMDFIEQIIRYKEEPGFIIGEKRGNLALDRLDEFSLQNVIGVINGMRTL